MSENVSIIDWLDEHEGECGIFAPPMDAQSCSSIPSDAEKKFVPQEKREGETVMNNAPCRDCASREVGCHAGCERYKAYADGRKTALENRYTACIEGTGKKRSHERWLDQQKRRAR